MYRVATDVGGTFTDLVYFEIDAKSGKALSIKTAKSDTTPSSYEKGVFDTINKAKEALERDFKPISDMRSSGLYRMEVAKNLLEKCCIEIKKNKIIGLYT